MVSFPNEYYCSCYRIKTDPNGLSKEDMDYFDQADSCMSEMVNKIKDFFARLF